MSSSLRSGLRMESEELETVKADSSPIRSFTGNGGRLAEGVGSGEGFYLLIFRERGREGEREGKKHQCVVAS